MQRGPSFDKEDEESTIEEDRITIPVTNQNLEENHSANAAADPKLLGQRETWRKHQAAMRVRRNQRVKELAKEREILFKEDTENTNKLIELIPVKDEVSKHLISEYYKAVAFAAESKKNRKKLTDILLTLSANITPAERAEVLHHINSPQVSPPTPSHLGPFPDPNWTRPTGMYVPAKPKQKRPVKEKSMKPDAVRQRECKERKYLIRNMAEETNNLYRECNALLRADIVKVLEHIASDKRKTLLLSSALDRAKFKVSRRDLINTLDKEVSEDAASGQTLEMCSTSSTVPKK